MLCIKITHNGNFNNVESFLTKYIKENTTCKVNESLNEEVDLSIIIEYSELAPAYYFVNNNTELLIRVENNVVNNEWLISICRDIFKKFNIDSLDYDFSMKDINKIADIEDRLAANYDKTDNGYFKDINEPNIPLYTARRAKGSEYYCVRRNFRDIESEKYYGLSLARAVKECERYPGLSVFNENGKLIYKSTRNKITPTQNHFERVTQRAIINTPSGTGIYVSNNGKKFHIPNGTEVIITKIHNTKTEITVTIAGEKIKAEINSACLK